MRPSLLTFFWIVLRCFSRAGRRTERAKDRQKQYGSIQIIRTERLNKASQFTTKSTPAYLLMKTICCSFPLAAILPLTAVRAVIEGEPGHRLRIGVVTLLILPFP